MSGSLRQVRTATPGAIPEAWRSAVVAIGNFDGVHRGHQAVLAAALAEAEHRGTPCLMLTFEPHPRVFFTGRAVFRLTPAPLKASLAAAIGLDGTLVIPFDRNLAARSAEDFVRDFLVADLAIAAAVTGYDFHFGRDRRGTPAFLQDQGVLNGFSVTIVDASLDDAGPVSSTRVRAALQAGDLASANALLGWRFALSGTIVGGEQRGRTLGYPTANMHVDPATELAHGIYAVQYLRPDGSLHPGVASFGRRPTFDDGEPLFETFLFDFSDDLYGETALVSLVARLRPERRFDGADALVAQMDRDARDARAALARLPPGDLDARLRAAWRTQSA